MTEVSSEDLVRGLVLHMDPAELEVRGGEDGRRPSTRPALSRAHLRF